MKGPQNFVRVLPYSLRVATSKEPYAISNLFTQFKLLYGGGHDRKDCIIRGVQRIRGLIVILGIFVKTHKCQISEFSVGHTEALALQLIKNKWCNINMDTTTSDNLDVPNNNPRQVLAPLPVTGQHTLIPLSRGDDRKRVQRKCIICSRPSLSGAAGNRCPRYQEASPSRGRLDLQVIAVWDWVSSACYGGFCYHFLGNTDTGAGEEVHLQGAEGQEDSLDEVSLQGALHHLEDKIRWTKINKALRENDLPVRRAVNSSSYTPPPSVPTVNSPVSSTRVSAVLRRVNETSSEQEIFGRTEGEDPQSFKGDLVACLIIAQMHDNYYLAKIQLARDLSRLVVHLLGLNPCCFLGVILLSRRNMSLRELDFPFAAFAEEKANKHWGLLVLETEWLRHGKKDQNRRLYQFLASSCDVRGITEVSLRETKNALTRFSSKLSDKWAKCGKNRDRFFSKNSEWIAGDLVFHVCLHQPRPSTSRCSVPSGRPQKQFEVSCSKTKRRRVEDLLTSRSTSEIMAAAEFSARLSGKRNLATVTKGDVASTEKCKAMKESVVTSGNILNQRILTKEEALAYYVDSKAHSYKQTRKWSLKTGHQIWIAWARRETPCIQSKYNNPFASRSHHHAPPAYCVHTCLGIFYPFFSKCQLIRNGLLLLVVALHVLFVCLH
nr:unnamed protein product [Callosobruchus chinensis]